MQLEAAHSFIRQKLEEELPVYLGYHNTQHSEEVYKHARELAAMEDISPEDLTLLSTAALFHDTGFLETYTGHEKISCGMAETFLPRFGYTDGDIQRVCSLIMATALPQDPGDRVAEILCDADLYFLGTDEYSQKAESLYQELHRVGLVRNREEWTQRQIKFLQGHQYFTGSAEKLLAAGKQKNLAALQSQTLAHKSVTGHQDFQFTDLAFIIVGVVTAGFALEGFLVPNDFFDGGITGISLLIHQIFKFNLAWVILLANLPFVAMGMVTINRRFAFKTFVCITLLGLCLLFIPYPVITSDKLLVAIFGGFFLGLGIGLTMRAGCAVDGIEVLALYTWRRTSFTISEIILALNVIIFGIAATHFGIPTALYSMLTYFTASKTIDYVVEGIEAYTGVTIISGKSEMIKSRLVNELGRGITVYKGERGYLPGRFEIHDDCDIIFAVITRLELRKLKNLVNDVDPHAFVFASTIKEASGGVIKRRHIH
jgi:uncharacterized membrane-anchored protein YitT (DUF2179 family)/predicted metal-dependent HD superfamily phosphohydrolase